MRSAQFVALVAIVTLQAVGVSVLTGIWTFQFFNGQGIDFVSSVSLLLVMVAFSGWLIGTTVGLRNRRRWALSSSVVIQIMGVILGLAAIPQNLLLGWLILGPAIIALVILLSRNIGKQISEKN